MKIITSVQDTGQVRVHSGLRLLSIYSELAKARLTTLVLMTTLVGFLIATPGSIDFMLLFWTLIGTGLSAAGANGLNQWIEVQRDAVMHRTQDRPLPSGQCSRCHAFFWAIGSACLGILSLGLFVNAITAVLSFAVVCLYVLVYTPLKPITPFCTLAGAICGAIPPMMGWTAVTGHLSYPAWLLGSLLFVWQIPHFLSLAWLYREDYERGGFRMLPIIDKDGHLTCRVIFIYTLALIPITLAFTLAGISGWIYGIIAIAACGYMLYMAVQLFKSRLETDARKLFYASLIYLPLVLGVLVADRTESNSPLIMFNAGNEIQNELIVHVVPFSQA